MNTNNRVYDAIHLNEIDNVITSIRSLKKDQVINIKVNEKIIKIRLIDDIPICHRIAFNSINKGSHVHIHNVKSLRG